MTGGKEVEAFVREIIQYALSYRSEDIHILPKAEEYVLYIREYNRLKAFKRLEAKRAEQFISYIKYQSNMDIGERRRPQSSSCIVEISQQKIELRISIIPNFKMQESVVIRLLDIHREETVDSFTYSLKEVEQLRTFLKLKSGLVLFSGPVSSGKTSIIYQLLREQQQKTEKQVIVMEDPVEIKEENFLQCEVNEKAGITYELLIKSSLRHHPDMMVIGEIRDEETAKMVIRGALTGHLMIASVHAKDCEGVILRMLELGVSKELLYQTVVAISAQRLIPRWCPLCEGNCHVLCNHYAPTQKKGTVFDILYGERLIESLQSAGKLLATTHSLNRKLAKLYGLGYISKASYEAYQVI